MCAILLLILHRYIFDFCQWEAAGKSKIRIGSVGSTFGENVACENDEEEPDKKEETPISLRHLAQCRNLAIDQGYGSCAIADNLEAGVSCELGNGDFTKN